MPAKDGRPEKWLYLDTRRPHTHDVRAMLVLNAAGTDPLLLTGANDAQLFAYSVSRFQTVSFPPPPRPSRYFAYLILFGRHLCSSRELCSFQFVAQMPVWLCRNLLH